MDILIDDINILSEWGINVMNYTPILSVAAERDVSYEWGDRSGVQKGDTNSRYESMDVNLPCYLEDTSEIAAYGELVKFTDYLFNKGVGYGNGVSVLTLANSSDRTCFLIDRVKQVVSNTNIQAGRAILVFDLELRIINPRAKSFQVVNSDTFSFDYGNRQRAMCYWGDGSSELLDGVGTYSHAYKKVGDYSVMIDIDTQDYISTIPNIPITVTPGAITKQRKGGEDEILVTCSDDWTINEIPAWITFENLVGLTVTGGVGSENLRVKVGVNDGGMQRVGAVKFRSISAEAVLTITQDGYEPRTTGIEERTTGVAVRIVN